MFKQGLNGVVMRMSMPFTPKVKLQKVGNSFMITVPPEVLENLKWNRGDLIEVDVHDGVMTAKKVNQ
jgi:antitoxin component of MazEF toxin-antitoxin module